MLEFFINLKSIEHSCPPYMALRWLFMTRAGDWGEGEGGGGSGTSKQNGSEIYTGCRMT